MAIAQRHARPQQVYMAQQGMGRGGPSGLADVLEVLLDKGLVIDAFVRVSLVGIELLTIDARVVVASVDTYLRFAEAVNRLDLIQADNSKKLGDLFDSDSSSGGGRALSERNTRSEPPASDDGAADPAPSRREQEPRNSGSSDSDEDDSLAGSSQTSRESNDDEGSHDDDKGILSRIKERGQVF